MTAPTHAAFGTLCYFIVAAYLWWTVSPAVAAVGVLGALLPDIDIPTSAVGRPLFPIAGVINQQVGHRTLTHSLLGMGVVGLFAIPLPIFSRAEFYKALLIGYLSHLLIDTENKRGSSSSGPRASGPGSSRTRSTASRWGARGSSSCGWSCCRSPRPPSP